MSVGHLYCSVACRKEAKRAMVTKHELDFGCTNDNKLNWGKRQEANA